LEISKDSDWSWSPHDIALEAEVQKYRGIAASELRYGRHGSFITAFLGAFLKADLLNVRILLPAMMTLTKKYHLEDKKNDATD